MTPSSWIERRCADCGAPSAARIDGRDVCSDHLSQLEPADWWQAFRNAPRAMVEAAP